MKRAEVLALLPVLSAAAVHAVATGAWPVSLLLALAASAAVVWSRAATRMNPWVLLGAAVAGVGAGLAVPVLAPFAPGQTVGPLPRVLATAALAMTVPALRARQPARGRASPLPLALGVVVAGGMARVGTPYIASVALFALATLAALAWSPGSGPALSSLTRKQLAAWLAASLLGAALALTLILLLPPAAERVTSAMVNLIRPRAVSGMSDGVLLQRQTDITLSDEVALRVHGAAPELLRGYVLTTYRNGRWLREPTSREQEVRGAAGRDQSAAGRDPSAAGRDQSAAGRDPSPAGRDQSAAGRDQSAAGRDQSAAGRDQSAAGRDQSAAGPRNGIEEIAVVPVKETPRYFVPLGSTPVRLKAGRALRDSYGQLRAPPGESAGTAWLLPPRRPRTSAAANTSRRPSRASQEDPQPEPASPAGRAVLPEPFSPTGRAVLPEPPSPTGRAVLPEPFSPTDSAVLPEPPSPTDGAVLPEPFSPTDSAVLPEPPSPTDSAVPPELAAVLAPLAREWTADAASAAARLDRLLDRFHRDFTYSLRHQRRTHRDPVVDFLLAERNGHCEYFASAMALMARAAGVPARVVTGYRVHETNPLGGFRVVRERDAHAWVEAWVYGAWRTYDPTPPAYLATLAGHTPLARGLLDWLAARWRDGNAGTARAVARDLGMPAALLVAAVVLLRRLRRPSRRVRATLAADRPWPEAEALFRTLASHGWQRAPWETLESFGRRLRAAPAPAAQAADLIDDYARLRYGAIGTREELQARLHEAARHR